MGDSGPTLVVGLVGNTYLVMACSKVAECCGFDTGELGTEDGVKSDVCSEKTDHRLDGPDLTVDIESLGA